MTLKSPSRSTLILGRWTSVLACGVVAAAVLLVLEAWIVRLGSAVSDAIGSMPPSAILAVSSVLFATCAWTAARGRWRGFVGIRFLPGYPPLWVSVVVGVATWIAGRSWISGADDVMNHVRHVQWAASQVPSALLALAGLFFLSAVAVPHLPTRRAGHDAAPPPPKASLAILQDFGRLQLWLQNDHEVDCPEHDFFGHNDIAVRMSERLLSPTEAPTMALIGPLGSGKSTVRRLVERRLMDTPRVCIVSLSLWPFDSPEAAVRGILRAVTQGLSRHVNVLPLVGLSDDYISAIEKTVGGFGGVARLLRGASDPEALVQRVANVAQAAGLRLVLWIEDLERFSGGDQLEGASRTEREIERLGAIRSLLHLLDRAPNLSVVMSDISLRSRFDLGKIARFVEQIPAMPASDAWPVVESLRQKCLGGYPTDVIDPATIKVREEFLLKRDSFGISEWLSDFRDTGASLPASIVRTVRTPRALKNALRLTLEAWEVLPGEIDFDAVLVASVLRTTQPDLFALLNDHIRLFQHGLTNPLSAGGKNNEPHRVVTQVQDTIQRAAQQDDGLSSALDRLVSFLFPIYTEGGDSRDDAYADRPQGLFVDRHANYWRRYAAQSPVAESERDQAALKSIRAWLEKVPSDLLERLIDPNRSNQIETFVKQFKPRELCWLASDLVDRVSNISAEGWERGGDAPGIVPVWRMMQRHRPREADVVEMARAVVRRIAPVHLPLAHYFSYYIAGSSERVSGLMSESQQDAVHNLLRQVLRETFVGTGAVERLMAALRSGSPWTLYWIARGRNKARPGELDEVPFEGWAEFAPTLLALAESHPSTGVPAVVPFVTRSEMEWDRDFDDDGTPQSVHRWVASFDADRARRLFPFERLIRTLAQFDVPTGLSGQGQAHCQAAVEAARQIQNGAA